MPVRSLRPSFEAFKKAGWYPASQEVYDLYLQHLATDTHKTMKLGDVRALIKRIWAEYYASAETESEVEGGRSFTCVALAQEVYIHVSMQKRIRSSASNDPRRDDHRVAIVPPTGSQIPARTDEASVSSVPVDTISHCTFTPPH